MVIFILKSSLILIKKIVINKTGNFYPIIVQAIKLYQFANIYSYYDKEKKCVLTMLRKCIIEV